MAEILPIRGKTLSNQSIQYYHTFLKKRHHQNMEKTIMLTVQLSFLPLRKNDPLL